MSASRGLSSRRDLATTVVTAALVIGGGLAYAAVEDSDGSPRGCGGEALEQTGARLTYTMKPTSRDRATRVLCARARALGVGLRVRPVASDRLRLELASEDAAALTRPGALAVYDWEPNVLAADGRPAAADAAVTGGPLAGRRGAIPLYDAILRAKGRPAISDDDNSRARSVFYAVDSDARNVYHPGGDRSVDAAAGTRAETLATVPRAERAAATVHEVSEGTVLIRAEQPGDPGRKTDRWFVLDDEVALTNPDIRDPEQNFDQASGQPVVAFRFTAGGREAWRELTRAIARRGQATFQAGSAGQDDPQSAAQHFAIAVDGELLSVPFVDFRQNPDGVDARRGAQIEGGFTIDSARELAAALATGPLPRDFDRVR